MVKKVLATKKKVEENLKKENTNDEKKKFITKDLIKDLANKAEDEDIKLIFEKELGLSKIFVNYHEHCIKIVNKMGDGYYFNQSKALWEEKDSYFFIKIMSEFLSLKLSEIIREKVMEMTPVEISDFKKIQNDVKNWKRCSGIFNYARSSFDDYTFQKKLNSIPHLLPIRKGLVIDLKTGKTRNRRLDDYFDFEIDLDFTPTKTNNSEKFFAQIFRNEKDVVDYVQMSLGYCITGEINQRCIYIFWGKGSNGKSTLCDLLQLIMGKLCVSVEKKVFIKDNGHGAGHTAHLIPLIGSRLAIFSETEDTDELNESTIKQLTGGDMISARQLYGKQFQFKPVSKYIVLTNHKPKFKLTQAMIDRVRLIPFLARFSNEKILKENETKSDFEFIEKLKTIYLSEIFTWLCLGAIKYYSYIEFKKPIEIPKSVKFELDTYINEMRSPQRFRDERFIVADSKDRIKKIELYNSYLNWLTENQDAVNVKQADFYTEIEKLGHPIIKSNGTLYFTCIKEINDE